MIELLKQSTRLPKATRTTGQLDRRPAALRTGLLLRAAGDRGKTLSDSGRACCVRLRRWAFPAPPPRSQYVLHLGRGEFGAGTGMLDALCFVSLKKRVTQLQ